MKYDDTIESLSERIRSQIIELKDIAFEIVKLKENTDYNPKRIEQINERLNLLYTLEQKHRVNNEEELIATRNRIADTLQKIDVSEDAKQRMEIAIAKEKEQLHSLAKELSSKRQKVLNHMESDLQKVLELMSMPMARIEIRMETEDDIHENGLDKVAFWFSANPGMEMQALDKIASGGELSRLMLALKSLISQKNVLPTIIFDEIDSGVSGEVSAKMGKVIQNIAGYSQVIAITHVPQIAGKGKNHYLVYKQVQNGKTLSDIKKLSTEERIGEIAKMISNEKVTESSLTAAKQLLKT